MKTILHKVVTIFFVLSASFSLVSCGKGGDEEVQDPTALKKITIDYVVELTEDYLYFYDVTAVYGFGNSVGTTETITTDIWSLRQELDKDAVELPDRFFCKVTATPKNPAPAIDETKIYAIEKEYAFSVTGLRNDGQESILKTAKNSGGLTIKGSKVQALLDKGARTVVDFEYVRK